MLEGKYSFVVLNTHNIRSKFNIQTRVYWHACDRNGYLQFDVMLKCIM